MISSRMERVGIPYAVQLSDDLDRTMNRYKTTRLTYVASIEPASASPFVGQRDAFGYPVGGKVRSECDGPVGWSCIRDCMEQGEQTHG